MVCWVKSDVLKVGEQYRTELKYGILDALQKVWKRQAKFRGLL